MPEDATVRRAQTRLSIAAIICTVGVALPLLTAPLAAQAQVTAGSADVDEFFDGIELDRKLAAQYTAAAPDVTQVLDEAAMTQLEREIDAALAEDRAARVAAADAPATATETVVLALAGLGLFVFAGGVLTLAVRELRKDARQRRSTYRRRIRRRGSSSSSETAAATG